MQNKIYGGRRISRGMLKACLLLLLFTPPGLAQQTGAAQQPARALPVTGNDKSSTTLPKSVPKKSSDKNSKPSPATQFTPTEKIRADDAVAFPVDI